MGLEKIEKNVFMVLFEDTTKSFTQDEIDNHKLFETTASYGVELAIKELVERKIIEENFEGYKFTKEILKKIKKPSRKNKKKTHWEEKQNFKVTFEVTMEAHSKDEAERLAYDYITKESPILFADKITILKRTETK